MSCAVCVLSMFYTTKFLEFHIKYDILNRDVWKSGNFRQFVSQGKEENKIEKLLGLRGLEDENKYGGFRFLIIVA